MVATSAGGCRFIDSAQVGVNSPTGSISISAKNICLGQQTTFSTAITNSQLQQTDSIRWQFGDGTIQQEL